MPLVGVITPRLKIIPGEDRNLIFPVENPIILEYRSNNISGTATFARFTAVIADATLLVDGYFFEVNGYRVFFRDNPQLNEVPSFTAAGGNVNIILSALYFFFANNPNLNFSYLFDQRPDRIEGVATISGTAFNFTIAQAGAAFNLSVTPAANGFFAQTVQDYAVEVEVFCGYTFPPFLSILPINFNLGLANRAAYLEKRFSTDNIYRFDISQALKPFVKSTPPPFTSVSNSPKFAGIRDYTRKFAYRVWETYIDNNGLFVRDLQEFLGFNRTGDPANSRANLYCVNAAEPSQYTESEVFTNFKRRWRRKRFGGMAAIDVVLPLTNQPFNKLIDIRQPEFLYFIYERANTITRFLFVRYDFEFENCEVNNENYLTTSFNGWGNGIAFVEVGLRMIDLDAFEAAAGSKLKRFDVTIFERIATNPNAPLIQVTTPQRYIVNNCDRCEEKYSTLIFLNSMGGYDTVMIFGEMQKKIVAKPRTHSRTAVENTFQLQPNGGLTTPPKDYRADTEEAVFGMENEVTYNANTGWVDRAHYIWLKELALSTEIYFIDNSDEDSFDISEPIARAVVISKSEWLINQSDELYNLNIELRLGKQINVLGK